MLAKPSILFSFLSKFLNVYATAFLRTGCYAPANTSNGYWC
jgi:hypothetical protein